MIGVRPARLLASRLRVLNFHNLRNSWFATALTKMLPSEAPMARDLEDSHVSFLPFASFRVRAALDDVA